LTYGREARLPTDTMDNNLYTNQTIQLFNDLPRIRNQAREEIIKSQDKQKKYHDKKNKRKEIFKIGDKVLYYNAAKEKQWSGKLEEKFKGLYTGRKIIYFTPILHLSVPDMCSMNAENHTLFIYILGTYWVFLHIIHISYIYQIYIIYV
jgi:hypothetical protein